MTETLLMVSGDVCCGSRPMLVTTICPLRDVPSAVGPMKTLLGVVCSTGPMPVPVIARAPGAPSEVAIATCAD